MEVIAQEIKQVMESLARTPDRIASATHDVEEARLYFKPDEQTWSVSDILAHLRTCADVWGKNIEAMLTKDHPSLSYTSPRSWIKKTPYLVLPFHDSFPAFVQQRGELLHRLSSLKSEDWSRSALIEGREHSVFMRATQMATHEDEHCSEIEALLK